MKKIAKITLITLSLSSTILLQSCDLSINVPDTHPTTDQSTVNKFPIIAAFDYSPKSAVGKEDYITFTVVANDPEGEALQYTWTSTKGLLTSNSGSSVAWRPLKADGSFEPGLSNVTLIVSDGAKTSSATANIMISSAGTATIQNTEIIQTPVDSPDTLTPSAEPTAMVSPTATPTPTVAPTVTPTFTETNIFDNGNISGVFNEPTASTVFTLTRAYVITKMMTYHWNNAVGTTVTGTHSFRSSEGLVYGPYPTTGSPGQGGVVNAYWNSTPNITLPAGTYTIVDSDPATWAQNSGSQGKGMAIISGYPADSSSVPAITPSAPPAIDNSNATGELKQGGSVLPYYQLDFTTRYNYKTDLGIIKADGVPISGYKDGNANITLLSMGQTPFGEAFPPKFYWDVKNFNTKFLLLTSSFSWWGQNFTGEKFATLTVESTDGTSEVFDLIVGTHVAEWNGGSLTENPPAVRIVPAPPGSGESRAFVDRFELKELTDVKRISVELLKAPMWNNTEYGAWFIKGITLVGEWQI